jgi:V/A-type H+/Na+-transporting ATPase subunit A
LKRVGKVYAVVSNLVSVKITDPVKQLEICYVILPKEYGSKKLKAEVIKIQGDIAYVQVFESTKGLKVGCDVEFTDLLLEIDLAPGLLSKNLDGLQNDLEKFENIFLERGVYSSPINPEDIYEFTPEAKIGDRVTAGSWLGFVMENAFKHRIMVPFKMTGKYKIKELKQKGKYKIKDTVAVVEDSSGKTYNISMIQKWPVKFPIKAYKDKPRPFKLLETGIRSIDTLNPIMEGGTGFIPGPFGSGKTVLQHAISQQAEADLIVMAACGERANEVVELFKEFPELDDPRTGRKLMERTIIVCNTSNMPVAAREASVYTAMTICEYYRQMGLRVLLLADSTSRWAQALREISNRMEELPGPDAFPMDLPFIISNFYSRAGYVYLNNEQTASITFIGTVSPAGGNLKEPVTESTKKTARCFYALSQKRADTKRYPAIDPIDSYSKYLEYSEVQDYLKEKISDTWVKKVTKIKDMLLSGKEVYDQINILGDDSVPINYHNIFWKSEIIDFIILQQDAFDDVDKSSSIERQKYMLELVTDICEANFKLKNFEEAQSFYKTIINDLKQMNYSEFKSDKFNNYKKDLDNFIKENLEKGA